MRPDGRESRRKPTKRAENLLYLGLTSDLLGVISMIASYYTQENSSLLFNNLSEVIHQRCDGLKINIQLKVLHATVDLPQPVAVQAGRPGMGNRHSDHPGKWNRGRVAWLIVGHGGHPPIRRWVRSEPSPCDKD